MVVEELAIHRIEGVFAVCRLDAAAALPQWAWQADGLVSITRTVNELSIVSREAAVPEGVQAERGYVAYAVVGPLEFSMVGVLAKLTRALAAASVPLLAISTYDTDILLVKGHQRKAAEAALSRVARLRDSLG